MSRYLSTLAAIALLGCAPPEADESCGSITDCPVGLVCDLDTRTCVAEPTNAFQGAFACEVLPATAAEPTSMLGSEVLGRVEDRRIVLPLGAFCYHNPIESLGETVLEVNFLNAEGITLSVRLPWYEANRGGWVPLGPTRHPMLPRAGHVHRDMKETYGYVGGGGVLLHEPAVVGATIHGWLDISIAPTIAEPIVYGVQCDRGVADCGSAYWDPYCMDVPTVGGDVRFVCTSFCDTDVDCALGGGICLEEIYCLQPCNTDNDCVPPLGCYRDKDTGRGGCL